MRFRLGWRGDFFKERFIIETQRLFTSMLSVPLCSKNQLNKNRAPLNRLPQLRRQTKLFIHKTIEPIAGFL